MPPSTAQPTPLTRLAASDARNATTAAISSGRPEAALRRDALGGAPCARGVVEPGDDLGEHRRVDHPGQHGVDPHARERDLRCGGARQAEHRVLGGVVGRRPRQPALAGERPCVDHGTGSLGDHDRQDVAQPEEDAAHVDGHDPVEGLLVVLGQRADRPDDPGVVEEDVDRPEGLHGLGDVAPHVLRPRDVGLRTRTSAPVSATTCAASRSRAASRSTSSTLAPARPSATPVAQPIPPPPPVMTAAFPSSVMARTVRRAGAPRLSRQRQALARPRTAALTDGR